MEQILGQIYDGSPLPFIPADCSGGFLGVEFPEGENTYNDVDDFITGPSPRFDGEIEATDPLAGRGLRTNVRVEFVNVWVGPLGRMEISGSSCGKRITVEVVDVNTGRVLVAFRSMASPYK